jgi:hypothetical protein
MSELFFLSAAKRNDLKGHTVLGLACGTHPRIVSFLHACAKWVEVVSREAKHAAK